MSEPIIINKLKGMEAFIAKLCDSDGNGKLEEKNAKGVNEISLFNSKLADFRSGKDVSIFDNKEVAPRDATYVAPSLAETAFVKSADPKPQKSKCNYSLNSELSDKMKTELEEVKVIFQKNEAIYNKVAKATGLPAELICAIHYREGRGNLTKRIQDGRDLVGKDWAKNAIDTLKTQSYCAKVSPDDIKTQLEYAERYNGLGYRKKGRVSPYVYSGTEKYTGGMYVRDGKFSPNVKDSRPGVAALLKSLYGEYPEDNHRTT